MAPPAHLNSLVLGRSDGEAERSPEHSQQLSQAELHQPQSAAPSGARDSGTWRDGLQLLKVGFRIGGVFCRSLPPTRCPHEALMAAKPGSIVRFTVSAALLPQHADTAQLWLWSCAPRAFKQQVLKASGI